MSVPFLFGGLLAPGWLSSAEPYLILGLMLLVGLPHGATDQRLFQSLHRERRRHSTAFYLSYVGIIAGYGLLWYLLPVVAFAIFIVLALYHFGQSNWAHVRYAQAGGRNLHYLLWGAGVLFTPILLHYGEAAGIVGSMTGGEIAVPDARYLHLGIAFLTVGNLLVIVQLYRLGRISRRQLSTELLSYGLLTAIALTHSLLLSFTLYFVFWHSLESLVDQFRFLRGRLDDFSLRDLLREVAPTVGGALAFCGYLWFTRPAGGLLSPELYGGIFIFISLLTLPHMLLVDRLYREWTAAPEASTVSR